MARYQPVARSALSLCESRYNTAKTQISQPTKPTSLSNFCLAVTYYPDFSTNGQEGPKIRDYSHDFKKWLTQVFNPLATLRHLANLKHEPPCFAPDYLTWFILSSRPWFRLISPQKNSPPCAITTPARSEKSLHRRTLESNHTASCSRHPPPKRPIPSRSPH